MTFVAVEGLDGAGTTTLAQNIHDKLFEYGPITATSEPYEYEPKSWESLHTKIYGFLHDRALHCDEVIGYRLERDWTVICDRYRDSTLAYQAHDYADEKNIRWENAVGWLNGQHYPWLIEPDATIYIDVPVKTAMRRNDGNEAYEELEQAKEVYDYLYHGEYHDSETVIVDGTQPIEDVVDEALWKTRQYHSLYESA